MATRPYRRSLLDRYGPDFARVFAAAGWCALGAVPALAIAATYAPAGWSKPLIMAGAYVATWALLLSISLLAIRPPGAVAEFYLSPSGASTPYEEQFSREQALVMQGRLEEALAALERHITGNPTAVAARIRAADLYAGPGKNPQRAARLFAEAQRVPGLSSGDDLYIGNRLADLYLGPLGTPARALVELRRLLDRYPGSRVAPQLRAAIASLKARHVPYPPAD